MQHIDANLRGIARVETGPLTINDDWAGYFVRGDDVFAEIVFCEQFVDAAIEIIRREQALSTTLPVYSTAKRLLSHARSFAETITTDAFDAICLDRLEDALTEAAKTNPCLSEVVTGALCGDTVPSC